MSETEYHSGELRIVPSLEGETLEQRAQRILEYEGFTRNQYHASWVDQFKEDLYKSYFIAGDDMYTVRNDGRDGEEGIFDATRNPDGTISYVLRYYNGGCSFEEAMESAMNNIK